MKSLKILIILLNILAIGISSALVLLNMIKNEENIVKEYNDLWNEGYNNIENSIIEDDEIYGEILDIEVDSSLKEVTEKSVLHSISNNINKYFEFIKDGNSAAVNELGGNNIYQITNNVKYIARQAYTTENLQMKKYYTYGILTTANGNLTSNEEEVYILITVDIENNTYKLKTITQDELSNLDEISENEDIDIPNGIYNEFEYEYMDNSKMMQAYLDDYSFQIFNNTEKAYTLLNEDYRNKRFPTRDIFAKYLIEKKEQLSNIKITQLNAEKGEDYTIYKGTDENGNYYYIRETAYMQYEIVLDNYTMQADYSDASIEEKIEKNTEKFILMLNAADYTNAYNLLEPTFKQTNFPTEQDFINYIKNNWYKRNIIASKEVTEDRICNVTIKEKISVNSNKMQKQFKVTLQDGMEFTIEFNV